MASGLRRRGGAAGKLWFASQDRRVSMRNTRIVFCSAREAWPAVRRGEVAAVRASYGARREGLLVKLMCSSPERLSALAESLGIGAKPCLAGPVPHIDLTGRSARDFERALGGGRKPRPAPGRRRRRA